MSATGRGAERRERDAYATPRWCVEALLVETAGSDKARDVGEWTDVLDPCCGNCDILAAIGYRYGADPEPHGLDIAPSPWSRCLLGDWLADWPAVTWPLGTRIVTNPPYRLAAEFIRTALRRGLGGWWLLRLPFLGSDRKRRDLWPYLREVLVLTPRPSFTGGGADNTEYAWFRFEPEEGLGPPAIGWARKGEP